MYAPSTLLVLALAAVARVQAGDISRGWAVLASSAPADSKSCGGGAYCPASLTCFDAKNSEVASCCPGSPCVGEIEGSPNCADAANSMFAGIDGNGFCCMPGQVGVIDRQARTMNCVASDAVGSATTASLQKAGTGAVATSSSAAPISSTTTATTTTASMSSSMSSSSSSSFATSTTTMAQTMTGPTNGTMTMSSSSSMPSSTGTNGANTKGAALGLMAAGLMAVAAL